MPNPLIYQLAATSDGKLREGVLHQFVDALTLGSCVFQCVSRSDDGLSFGVHFDSAPDAADEAQVDAVVAGHVGGIMLTEHLASGQVIGDEKTITEDQTWQEIGGVVTTVGYWKGQADLFCGHATMMLKTTGLGAEMIVTEDDLDQGAPPAERDICSAPIALPNTNGAWINFGLSTDVSMRVLTQNLYRLKARLNGATAAAVRYVTLAVLKRRGDQP